MQPHDEGREYREWKRDFDWFQKQLPELEKTIDQAQGKGWQPMETAPHSIPILLLIDIGDGKMMVWPGYYDTSWRKRYKSQWLGIDDAPIEGNPLFWMPFPPPYPPK